jgi:hypothetical protein
MDAGAAYIFVRNAGVWTQQAYLKASNTEANDFFGVSVAILGETVVVGAYLEDSNAIGINGDGTNNSAGASGAAYIFVRNAGVWTQQAYLKASNTEVSDYFGTSVAISGETVVVGAPLEASNATGVNGNQADNSASLSGAVYVFVRSGTTWTQQAYLKASNTEANDFFGNSVAISGETMVVGASQEASNATGINGDGTDNSAFRAGAAYIFVRNAGVWTQQAYLKASNTEANDFFGVSVAISGETVVVGAYTEASNATGINGNQTDNSAFQAGAVYIFPTGVPLPITLLGLKGERVQKGEEPTKEVKLDWSTASEINNKGFEVEMSEDGLAYQKIAFIEGRGNSTTIQPYSHTTIQPYDRYYRLKQVDFDGSFSYSPIVFVEGIDALKVYPNPNNGTFTISVGKDKLESPARLLDAVGKEVWRGVQTEVRTTGLPAGIYFLHTTVAGKTKITKVVIQ